VLWLEQNVGLVFGFSLLLFVIAFVIASIFVVGMPADYFVEPRSREHNDYSYPVFPLMGRVLKNVAGIALLVLGVLLSLPLVPGPGLLLVLMGLALTDFPRKRRLEIWIVQKRFVLRPANWLRSRFGRPEIKSP